jgi:hypothetical protein
VSRPAFSRAINISGRRFLPCLTYLTGGHALLI